MKKLLMLAAAFLILAVSFAQADMDTSVLMSQPNARMWMLNESDMAIRTVQMPFLGRAEQEDWEVSLYIDFCKLGALDATAVRVTVSTIGFEELFAEEVRITVGGRTWSFAPSRAVSEYDLVYYEDFYACLDHDALELVKALAKGKGTCTVTLRGSVEVTASITVPAEEADTLLNLYRSAGGMDQDLSDVAELWPVTVSK